MHVRKISHNCTVEQGSGSKAISVYIFTIGAWTAVLIPAACMNAALLPSTTVTMTLISMMTNKRSDSG